MDFWGFFRGSENPSVLWCTRIFRFSEKLKKALISSQTSLLTKQPLYIRLFVFCLFAPSLHGYPVSRGVPKIKIVIILMRFWRFLASSYEGAYFGVRNRVRFCQKLKKARIVADLRGVIREKVLRAKHVMSLRGARRRGNLPEGQPYYIAPKR